MFSTYPLLISNAQKIISNAHPIQNSRQILTSLFKISEHRKVDKRINSWGNLLQPGIHDQRTHVSRGKETGVFAGLWPTAAASALEMGKRDYARPTRQRNDPKVDAAT